MVDCLAFSAEYCMIDRWLIA